MVIAISIYTPTPTKAQSNFSIHGYLSASYRSRWTEDVSDKDIYQYINLNIGERRTDQVTAHIFGRGTYDMDGRLGQDHSYTFDTITDKEDRNLDGRLYFAYLDIHRVEYMDQIRIGRQTMYETPVLLYFDGPRAETEEFKSLYRF